MFLSLKPVYKLHGEVYTIFILKDLWPSGYGSCVLLLLLLLLLFRWKKVVKTGGKTREEPIQLDAYSVSHLAHTCWDLYLR